MPACSAPACARTSAMSRSPTMTAPESTPAEEVLGEVQPAHERADEGEPAQLALSVVPAATRSAYDPLWMPRCQANSSVVGVLGDNFPHGLFGTAPAACSATCEGDADMNAAAIRNVVV